MDKGTFKYHYLEDLTWSFSALYFLKRYRLFTSLGYHRFVYKDHGLRLDIFRFFNEFQFGLWSVYADDSFNGGFKFSIPLPPCPAEDQGNPDQWKVGQTNLIPNPLGRIST